MNKISIGTEKEKLQLIFNSLAQFCEEALFEFKENSLLITCLNRDNSAYLSFEISKDFFKEYVVENPEKFKLLIKPINKVINKCSTEILFEVTDFVKITSIAVYKIEAKLLVILGEDTLPKIDDKKYDNILCLNITEFKEILEIITSFSKFAEIYVDQNVKKAKISSKEAGGSSMDVSLPLVIDKTEIKSGLRLNFNAGNIGLLLSQIQTEGVVYLNLHQNEAIKLEYILDNLKIKLISALVSE